MPRTGFLNGFGFETLIAPCDRQTFTNDIWGKKPHIEARKLPDFYSGLLSLEDVDAVLARNSRNTAHPGHGDLDIDAALRRLELGAALVLEEAQHQLPALALVCRTVQAELGFRCSMAIEVTMPSNKPHPPEPLEGHTFVLQLTGRRDWHLESPAMPAQFILESGDLLYLPPGVVMRHRSTGDKSIMALLTITPPRWVDMTGNRALANDISLPLSLSESLPPGWIKRDRSELVSELARRWRQADDLSSVEAAVSQLIETEVRAFPVDMYGRLMATMHPSELRVDMRFSRRRDLLWTLQDQGAVTRLIAGPLTIDLTSNLVPATRFCLSEDRFMLDEIPGNLGQTEREALLDRLIRNGLVVMVGA